MPQSDRHGRQHWLQQLAFFSIRWELELVLQKEHFELLTLLFAEPWCHRWQASAQDWDQQSLGGTFWPWLRFPFHRFPRQSVFALVLPSLFVQFLSPLQVAARWEWANIQCGFSFNAWLHPGTLYQNDVLPCKQFLRVPSPACFTVLTGKPMCLVHSSLATLTSLRASLLSWGSCWFHLWKISWTSISGWAA